MTFPPLTSALPLTPKTIEVARGMTFEKAACPLCGAGNAGCVPMPHQAAAWWICGTCQRFSITDPAAAHLRSMIAQRHPRNARIRTGLSRKCAASKRVIAIDEDHLIALADAGLALRIEAGDS